LISWIIIKTIIIIILKLDSRIEPRLKVIIIVLKLNSGLGPAHGSGPFTRVNIRIKVVYCYIFKIRLKGRLRARPGSRVETINPS
jgi:hypothetical protein